MTLDELQSLAQGLAPVVKRAIDDATGPLLAKIGVLEAEFARLNEFAPTANDVAVMVEAKLAEIGPPRDGKDGADGIAGKDADPVTAEQIAEAVRLHLEANPPPPGQDGKDGADGKDGRDGVDGTAGADGVNGKDGRDGVDGRDGANGIDGQKGEDGADGIGLAGAVIDKDGQLVVTLTNGAMRELGAVVGKNGDPGAPGEPGRDAIALTGFDASLSEDGRHMILSLENDETRITHELQLPVMIYRGVFKDRQTYLPGDTVTFGGSLWHCNAETADKPLEGRDAWQLATRKGRDGKDGKS
jgi:hypothetical protein